jgi:hypothetical protein
MISTGIAERVKFFDLVCLPVVVVPFVLTTDAKSSSNSFWRTLRSYKNPLSLRDATGLADFSIVVAVVFRLCVYLLLIVGEYSESVLLAECLRVRCRWTSASSGRSNHASICSSDISHGRLRIRSLRREGLELVGVEVREESMDTVLYELYMLCVAITSLAEASRLSCRWVRTLKSCSRGLHSISLEILKGDCTKTGDG